MGDQGSLFDPEVGVPQRPAWQGGHAVAHDLDEGQRLRDAAMARVLAHANESYKQAFDTVVRDFVQQGQRFTSEDVTARIGLPPSGSPNAVGALTRAAAVRYGYVKVGRIKATRTNQHATEIGVWGPRG